MERLDRGAAFLRRLPALTVLAVLMMLVAFTGGGCSDADGSPEVVKPGVEFTLAPGSSAELPGDALRVTFERVKDDSRCPQDVQCVWAGDAVAVISTGQKSYELHVNPQSAQSAVVGRYVVRLTRLQPPPHAGGHINPASYRATLRIDTT